MRQPVVKEGELHENGRVYLPGSIKWEDRDYAVMTGAPLYQVRAGVARDFQRSEYGLITVELELADEFKNLDADVGLAIYSTDFQFTKMSDPAEVESATVQALYLTGSLRPIIPEEESYE